MKGYIQASCDAINSLAVGEANRDGANSVLANTITARSAPVSLARCVNAWRRVLEAIADQRQALDHRIWRGDPEDAQLAADVRTWCELSQALADFLHARRLA